jgi:hypothetical protein
VKRQASYLEPFGWWGPAWSPPAPASLDDLVAGGMLSDDLAATLITLVGRRASIVVAAEPSGAGKTTFLTALLDHLPAGTTRVYIRGCYELFNFLDETNSATTALLVNEISPHLPIYLWGPGVRRTFEAVKSGYQLAATAHARSIEDFIYSLTSYPLRISSDLLRAVDLLVLIDVTWEGNQPIRRVTEVVSLSADAPPGTIRPERLACLDAGSDAFGIDNDAVKRLLDRLSQSSYEQQSREDEDS